MFDGGCYGVGPYSGGFGEPMGVAVFYEDVIVMPRKWADNYYNLKRWTPMPSGGHFASMEEPQLLVDDVRAFFRSLR